jgi:hypothetical protein
MNLNETCGTDASLIESCPTVVQTLYVLSSKSTFKCTSDTDGLYYVHLAYFIVGNVSSQRYMLANTEIKPRANLLTNKCKK